MLAAQSSLLENISDNELDPGSGWSQDGGTESLAVKPSVARRRASLQEVENLYITVSVNTRKLVIMLVNKHMYFGANGTNTVVTLNCILFYRG